MADKYFLTEADRNAIAALIARDSKRPGNTTNRPGPHESDYLPPEMYFVRVPVGGIPAFNGSELGHVTGVEIYRVKPVDHPGTAPDTYQFDATGELIQDLYNAGSLAYTYENGFVPVQREKFGEWFVITRFAAGGSCSSGNAGEVTAQDQGFFGNKSWYGNNSDTPGFTTCAYTENVTNLPFGSNHHKVYEQTVGAFSQSSVQSRQGSSWLTLGQFSDTGSITPTNIASVNLIAERKKLSANLESPITDEDGPSKTYGWELEAVGTGDGSEDSEIHFTVVGSEDYPLTGYAVTSTIGSFTTVIPGISAFNCCGDEFIGGILVGTGPGSESTGTAGTAGASPMMAFKLPGHEEPLPRTLYLTIESKTIPLQCKYTYREGWIGVVETPLGKQDTYILRCPKQSIKAIELIHINHEQEVFRSEGTITDPPAFSVSGNLEYGSVTIPYLVTP